MHKSIVYTLLYGIPAVLIAYGLWQNIFAFIMGAAWMISSFIIFELPKRSYD
jgi:uncharacterized membrane protein YhaH (DUF805 family)